MSGLVLDAFGGPGGASEGMRQLGIDSIGIEWDAAACATRAAAGHRTIRADVASFPLGRLVGKVEGIWLSPPCPTFSSAGNGSGRLDMPHLLSFCERAFRTGEWHDPWKWHAWGDPRTPLILEPIRWALTLRPEWVVCEQVPDAQVVFESIAAVLQEQGYSVWVGVVNCADLGIPQTRRRVILMASRVRLVHPPASTHAENPEPSLFGDTLLPWVTMAEALGWFGVDEPSPTITGGGTAAGAEPIGNAGTRRRLAGKLRTGANSMVTSRTGSRAGDGGVEPYERDIDRPAPTVDTKAGSAWNVILDRRQTGAPPVNTSEVPSPTLTAQAVAKGIWTLTRPATTVCGDPRLGNPGHRDRDGGEPQFQPDALRLSVPDALILQSFPPSYPVQGTRSKQFEQVGNAVPPTLARAVVAALIGQWSMDHAPSAALGERV